MAWNIGVSGFGKFWGVALMPVYLYEIEEGEHTYGFGVILPDDGTAYRLEKLLGSAVLIGELITPETTELEVFKKHLN